MSTAKQILKNLVEDMPENDALEVIDYISYLKLKRENEQYKALQEASASSLEFWDNAIDDEVWNDV